MERIQVLYALSVILTVILFGAVFAFFTADEPALGLAGSQAAHATTSQHIAGPGVTTLFSKSLNCGNRVVTTASGTVMISFDPNIAPSAVTGLFLPASTTMEFPSDLYGCGASRIYSWASTTVTKVEFSL